MSFRPSHPITVASINGTVPSATFLAEPGALELGFSLVNGSVASSTVTLQGSNDGGTVWVDTPLVATAVATGTTGFGVIATGIYRYPALFRLYRFKVVSTGAGTVTIDHVHFIY